MLAFVFLVTSLLFCTFNPDYALENLLQLESAWIRPFQKKKN